MRLSLFVPSMRGGGAERVMLILASEFAGRGYEVDLVLAKAEGPYLSGVPGTVRVVDLGASRVLASLPALVRYLRRERPAAMLSALRHANLVAIWARRLAGAKTRLVISEHSAHLRAVRRAPVGQRRLVHRILPPVYPNRRQAPVSWAARFFYHWADGAVAVSRGAAEDLVATTRLRRESVEVIHNPVVTPELLEKAREPVGHPWFEEGEPPVVLGVGRLTLPKNFSTLIRAFARVRGRRPARLLILGEGEERPRLEGLVRELGLEGDVSLPGFVGNPFPYMRRASVFALSSLWEALPTVLIEAMACGARVVSTDCPGGVAEVLEGGRYGRLVPVGDDEALAGAILAALDEPAGPGTLRTGMKERFWDSIPDRYLEVMLG